MEEIQLGVDGPFPVQISIGGPGDFAPSTGGAPNSTPGDDRSHAMKWLIGVLVEMTVVGGSTFQAASTLPKAFLVTYVAISLVLAVLDLALLVLLLCTGTGGQSLIRFAKGGAMVMMVLVLLLVLIPEAYAAL